MFLTSSPVRSRYQHIHTWKLGLKQLFISKILYKSASAEANSSNHVFWSTMSCCFHSPRQANRSKLIQMQLDGKKSFSPDRTGNYWERWWCVLSLAIFVNCPGEVTSRSVVKSLFVISCRQLHDRSSSAALVGLGAGERERKKVRERKRQASVFMHVESDRKGGSRDLILEADLGGHGHMFVSRLRHHCFRRPVCVRVKVKPGVRVRLEHGLSNSCRYN